MDDRRAALADLLRSCVQCGLCLPHCATYLSSGNEVQSPRGRLQLLGSLWDQRPDAAPDSYLAAFDQCIGCRACETVCPSGVPFTILEYGQHLAANGQGRSDAVRPAPAVPGPVLRRLDSPGFLNALRIAGSVGRGVASAVGGSTWRRKMAAGPKPVAELSRLLSSMPQSPIGGGLGPSARRDSRLNRPTADLRRTGVFHRLRQCRTFASNEPAFTGVVGCRWLQGPHTRGAGMLRSIGGPHRQTWPRGTTQVPQ